MTANSTFQMVNEQGWRVGLTNLLRKENRNWWHTRAWLVNIVIWLLIINGIGSLMLWTPEPTPDGTSVQQNDAAVLPPAEVAVPTAMMNLVILAGLFTPIGGIIAMQGEIIDEKKSGTAAWVLSKPVSRTAFVLSKLLPNAVALVIVTTVVQWAVTYVLFAIRGSTPPPGPFALGVVLLSLHLLFYVALTLLLGTVFSERGPVIAIPIGVLFSAQFLLSNFQSLAYLTPWPLIFPTGTDQPLVLQAMMGTPLTTIVPILATIIWIGVFVGLAIWRFSRDEF
jgi:ABC-2 type transport system permease protein